MPYWSINMVTKKDKITQREKLREKIKEKENEIRKSQYDQKLLKGKLHRRKLIEAGKIFEEAGILDSYNRERVLEILKKLEG